MDEQPPRHLRSVPGRTDMALRNAAKAWWLEQNREHWRSKVTLAEAMSDLGIISVGILIQELTAEGTPAEIRRKIALTMAPKLAVELRANGIPSSKAGPDDGDDVLGAYGDRPPA